MAVSCAMAADFCMHYSFEDASAAIKDNLGFRAAQYTPAASRDNDNAETSNPERYHKPGVVGKALYFFPALASYAEIQNFKLEATNSLYVRFFFCFEIESNQYVFGNKSDTGKNGFGIRRNGGSWYFDVANAGTSERTICKSTVGTRSWGLFELTFKDGAWEILENGKSIGKGQFSIKTIGSANEKMTFGNYPISNKTAYPMSGGLDELVFASSIDIAPKPDKNFELPRISINALVEPVEGNEGHFKGVKTMHVFEDCPLPAKFFLYVNNPAKPQLRIALPKGVDILDEKKSDTRKLISKKQLDDGVTEYLFGFDSNLANAKQTFTYHCLFKLPNGYKEGTVKWAALDDGKAMYEDAFVLKVLPPLPKTIDGQFYFMSWETDFNFNDENMRKTAELYKRVGLTGKGLFPGASTDAELLKKDKILHDEYGFKLFSIDIWDGPTRGRYAWKKIGEYIPRSINKNGKADPDKLCHRQVVDSSRAYEDYKEVLRIRLHPEIVSVMMMDYEPWSVPGNYCFCDYCREAFRKELGLDKAPTADEILKKYKTQWTESWTTLCERWLEMMAKGVKEIAPQMEVWDYTYVFPYDDEAKLNEKFFSIPKDVRRNEKHYDCNMLSLYHVNGYAAYEQTKLSHDHLKKPICQASLISRSNLHCGSYTAPQECLSPAQIYQKAVLFGAMGHTCYSIWPGWDIDGTALVAMADATRLVRANEKYYLNGKLADGALKINVKAAPKQSLSFTHEKDGKYLVSLFNFSNKPLVFDVERLGKISVRAGGVEVREVK